MNQFVTLIHCQNIQLGFLFIAFDVISMLTAILRGKKRHVLWVNVFSVTRQPNLQSCGIVTAYTILAGLADEDPSTNS